MHDLNTLLERFQHHATPSGYPWMFRHKGGKHDFHIVLSTLIHGNETGPLPAFLWAIEAIKKETLSYGGTATFLLGNPESAQKNQRFLESDLNRMFLDTAQQTHEAKRAREIMPLFDAADILIDFHQTILPSAIPFYICPWTDMSAAWAKALALSTAGVDATPAPGPATTRCADDYVSQRGKPAITIELGERGFHQEAETVAQKAITRAFYTADAISSGSSIRDIAYQQPEIALYATLHREPYRSPKLLLREGLINFLPVKKGEILSAPNTPTILAAIDGCILFPKYPAFDHTGKPLALPKEIFRIVAPISKAMEPDKMR